MSMNYYVKRALATLGCLTLNRVTTVQPRTIGADLNFKF